MYRRDGVRFLAVAAIVVAVAAALVGAAPDAHAAPSAHRQPVGQTPPRPAGAADRGPTSKGRKLSLTVVLRPSDAAALARYASGVSTRGSADYHHFLAPSSFAERFGAPAAGITAVRQWLGSEGFSVGDTSANNLSIPVTGTVKDVQSAFGVSIHDFILRSGRHAFANVDPPTVPPQVAGYVQTVIGLDNLVAYHASPPRPVHQAPGRTDLLSPSIDTSGPTACSSASTTASHNGAWTPAQLASAYGMNSLYSSGLLGGGVTVGLYELEPYLSSDIAAYQSCFGTNTSVTNVLTDGGAGTGAGVGEAALDIEDVIGLAPTAKILVYEAPNKVTRRANGPYDNWTTIVDQDQAQVVSTSWGMCEPLTTSSAVDAENTLFEQAATQGQTILAAAGDSGSTDCGSNYQSTLAVDDPASQPYVTGVGGTSLTSVSTPPAETVWNDQCSTGPCGGGGGISQYWTMPGWQNGPGVVSSDSSGSPCAAATGYYCREVPDVTASADPYHGYVIYYNGAWTVAGGTSAAAPLWASLVALVDNGCAAAPVGFINPRLYAAGATNTSPFNDITTGNNAIYGGAGGLYPATDYYDMASGLGSPIAARLLGDLCAPMLTSLSPASGPSAGGTKVTIGGVGFTPGTTVHFGSADATSVDVTSATSLTAVAPPGFGTVDVTVTTGGGTSGTVTADHFAYATPSISSLSAVSASEGSPETITGIGFGSAQGTSYVTFQDQGISWGAPGDAAGLTIDGWSSTGVIFTVPEPSGSSNQWQVTPGSTATVTVTIGGVTSNPLTMTIAPTSTFTMSLSSGSTTQPGATVTLSSSNLFGSSQGAGYVSFEDSGIGWGAPPDAAQLTNVSWSAGTISFTVPPTTGIWKVTPGTTATVTVTTASGAVSDSVAVPVQPVGTLSISTSTASATPGTQVTLDGTNLGSPGWVLFSDGAIGFGGPSDAANLVIDSWSSSAITFTVPTIQGPWEVTPGTTATVTVTNAAGYMSNTLRLQVQPTSSITISSISPTSAPEGTVVTLDTSGGFGSSQGSGYVTFDDNGIGWGAPSDAARLTIDSWSDTQITFTVPDPSGASYQWQVTPGTTATVTVTSNAWALSNTLSLPITATASIPLVSYSAPNGTSAGDPLTLTGSGFGATQGAGYVTFVDNGVSWGAPTDASAFSVSSWGNSTIVFDLPSPSGPGGEWALTPGTNATVTVTNTSGAVSNSLVVPIS